MESLGPAMSAAVLQERWPVKRSCLYEDQGEQGADGAREPEEDGKMDWYRMWARRTRCLMRLDVVAVGREKIGKDGHLRVVTETWAHQVKNLSRLQSNY